jgi:diadenosine tetraphosphatase ApaH/serine/threonine PP2A family protein phosphatase
MRMRYAIISDIHANLAAFRAVLDDVERRGGADKIWCMGDVVGYGPDPQECIEALRATDHVCVAGNHDLATIGRIATEEFNPDAAASAHRTARQLSADDVAYLGSMPLTIEQDDFTLVHGSPRKPMWEYVLAASQARENFAHFKTRVCVVGHSHTPLVFALEGEECYGRTFLNEVSVAGNARLIVNPGAVGQPRDRDPRAAYAIYDSLKGLITPRRVPYDIAATQARMRELELPVSLVNRLQFGV